jgi:hypothetical protein
VKPVTILNQPFFRIVAEFEWLLSQGLSMNTPKRTDEQYFADIRKVLSGFYQPGDVLTCTRHFVEPGKCQMCGGWVDIWNCFELENERSKQRIICGRECIVKYANVVSRMDQSPVVRFPETFKDQAAIINRMRPQTVTVMPMTDFTDEFEPDDDDEDRELYHDLGLDPDDPDPEDLAPHGMEADAGDDDDEGEMAGDEEEEAYEEEQAELDDALDAKDENDDFEDEIDDFEDEVDDKV